MILDLRAVFLPPGAGERWNEEVATPHCVNSIYVYESNEPYDPPQPTIPRRNPNKLLAKSNHRCNCFTFFTLPKMNGRFDDGAVGEAESVYVCVSYPLACL